MAVFQPSEAKLREVGSMKWTGMKTSQGQETMGAWVAEMDFATAPPVEDVLIRSVKDGLLGYPPYWAGDGAVESLVRFLERRTGWEVNAQWGRSYASVLDALKTVIDKLTRPGSAVIVPTPAYMPFLTIPKAFDREIIQVQSIHDPAATTPEGAWSLNLEGIEQGLKDGAGLVILCNPWNPTGRVLTVPELEAFHAVVSKYDALVFSDEIHGPLVYGDPASMVSYASLGESYAKQTITALAASKAWNIAGLPACQVIIPDNDLRKEWDLHTGWDRGLTLGNVAAIAAYTDGDEWLSDVLELLDANVRLLEEALSDTAVDYHRPQGTYLNWLGFEAYDLDRAPHEILLNDYRVATNDGKELGAGYEKWLRVNAAMSREPWVRTVEKIVEFAGKAPLK